MNTDQIKLACRGKSRSQGGLNVIDIKQILRSRKINFRSTATRQQLLNLMCSDKVSTLRPPPPTTKPPSLPPPTTSANAMVNMERSERLKQKPVYIDTRYIYHMAGVVEHAKLETGGLIDLREEGILDAVAFRMGSRESVDLDDMADFELYYHVHPYREHVKFEIPSIADIKVTYISDSDPDLAQAHVVFAPDAIYVLYNDRTHHSRSKTFHQISKDIDNVGAEHETKATHNLDDQIRYFNIIYDKCGVYIQRFASFIYNRVPLRNDIHGFVEKNWPLTIPIYIDIVEPGKFKAIKFKRKK